jgi:mitogen-activated protein kinase 1/3
MRKKPSVPFQQKFPNADPLALCLLQRLLAFDPKDRPTAEEVCVQFFSSCLSVLSEIHLASISMEPLNDFFF